MANSTITDNVMTAINTTIQVAKMVPFIQNAAEICDVIFQLATTAQHNKVVCKALSERVRIKQKWLEQEAPSEKCQKAFEQYISILKEIRDYIVELRAPGPFGSRFMKKVMKIVGANDVQAMHEDFTRRLDQAQADFHLDLDFDTHSIISNAQSVITETNTLVKEFIHEREKHDREERELIKIALNNKGVGATPKEIEESKINYEDFGDDEAEEETPVYRGELKQIQKKLFVPHGEYVALKRLGNMKDIKKETLDSIYKQIVLLSNFQSCTTIEKFYGTTIKSDYLYVATEWAEFGDLETYLYNNPGIEWKLKAKFVASISNALSWCHSRDILHHDVRCHNILLDENMTPKLSNFGMSRFGGEATTSIAYLTAGTRWTAPQKLKSIPYSKPMDVYSFGIVMWEIAAQALPFTDISSINEVALAILAGSRPSPIPSDTPADYRSLMESAWQEATTKRPTMQSLAVQLRSLAEKFKKHKSSSSSSSSSSSLFHQNNSSDLGIQAPRSNSPLPGVENSEVINETSLLKMTFANSKAEIEVQISELPAIKPGDQLPDWEHLEEMIKENRQINEAMPFIEVYAKQKNFFAQFYAGKFLYEGGSGVERDEDQALVYLKQAAEAQSQPGRRRLIARAQYMYAHACLKGSSYDQTAGMDFLKRATRNQEPRAYLLYAEILLDGLHAQPIDLDGAENFLKKYMAANPPEMKNKHVKGKFDNLMKRVQVYKKQQSLKEQHIGDLQAAQDSRESVNTIVLA
ncbi:hypothetical protein G9A89_009058 [Geosiphon pyriformis]|nr:hypothetical protein G9A89_009058 [Geosiphon pyriformis]